MGHAAAVASRCAQVDLDADELDVLSGELWAAGAVAVQELPLDDRRVRLIAGFPAEREADVVATMAVHGVVDVFDADHDGWLDAWRPFARPVHVGRVVVQPPWETVDAVDLHALVVSIDPGRAFGQGNHPTTRLMLALLQDLDLDGARVLDVGCGSGVLAIASVLLGAEHAVAIDIEDEAVRVTVENAERNGVSERVEASTNAVGDLTGVFDVVLANILAPVLIEVAPAIRARVAPRGRVVLSGFREDQRDAVVAAYAPLVPVDETFAPEWRLISFRDI